MKERKDVISLIKHRAHDVRHYPLLNPHEPNLHRHIFPYTEVSKIDFDFKTVPINPPEDFFITDTTFRDGQQARPPFAARQIVEIYKLLHRLSGSKGVIRQSEFFLYSERDRRAVEGCLELGYRYPEITGWIRAREEDFQLVKRMGLKETGILTSASDYHIFLKLRKTRKKALEGYLRVVETALSEGIKVRCHFEDITRADIYGFVIPFAQRLMELREQSGIDVKIRLCDTMGFGVPFSEVALPRSIPKLVNAMIEEAGVPSHLLEWHGHNDFHKGLVNGVAAWLYGCASVNGTLLGIGERTGNTPIEALVIEYISLKGTDEEIDTTVITEIANYFERELNHRIPPNYPFVGANFNATGAGIHIDGIAKNEEIYNIFDTEKILNRPVRIIINDKCGLSGIAQWINTYLRLTDERRVDKRHPGVARIYAWVKEQYAKGRVANISDDEMDHQARLHLPEYFISEFDQLKRHAHDMAAHLIERLADQPDIRSMQPKRQEPVLKKFVDQHPFVQFAYVIDLTGHKITRNITSATDQAAFQQLEVSKIDFSDRPWFTKPLEDGRIYVSDIYTSWITGRLIITVTAPVYSKRGKLVGVLGLDLKFEDLAKADEEKDEDAGVDQEVV